MSIAAVCLWIVVWAAVSRLPYKYVGLVSGFALLSTGFFGMLLGHGWGVAARKVRHAQRDEHDAQQHVPVLLLRINQRATTRRSRR